MSFLNIKDPEKRDQIVQDYLRTRKNIQQQNLAEKLDDVNIQHDLTKFYQPVIDNQAKQTKNIINELIPIQEGIRDLPKNLPTPILPNISNADEFHSVPSLTDVLEEESSIIGPIAEKYLKLYTSKRGHIDKSSGLHTDEKTGQFYIGNKVVDINRDNIVLGGKEYKGTQGLWELIVKNNPDEEIYDDKDLENYEEIMEKTHALRRNYDERRIHPNASKSPKWKNFGKRIWKNIREREGSGIQAIYLPSDPNALVERLILLVSSKQAGNTGVRNEIISILDELIRLNIIDKEEYKKLVTSNNI